jgi:hypothetical protein
VAKKKILVSGDAKIISKNIYKQKKKTRMKGRRYVKVGSRQGKKE